MKKGINTKLLIYILSTLTVIFSLTIGFVSIQNRRAALKASEQEASALAGQYANYTKAILEIYLDASRTLSQSFSEFEAIPEASRREAYMQMIRKVLQSNEQFLSVWTIWEPLSIDRLDEKYIHAPGSTRIGNFSPTFFKDKGKIKLEVSDPNATLFEGEYYTLPKNTLRESILNPYKYSYTGNPDDAILQTNMITPVIKDGKFMGVVGIDASLETLQEKLRDITPLGTGQVFLIANNGQFVAHRDKRYIGLPVDSLMPELVSRHLLDRKIREGEPFQGNYYCRTEQQDIYLSVVPVQMGKTDTPWAVGIAIPMQTILYDARVTFWQTIVAGFLGLILMALVVVYVSGHITRPLTKTTRVLEQLARGQVNRNENLGIRSQDEIGQMARALERLSHNLEVNARFARAIGQGELNMEYRPQGEEDVLGNALLQMRTNLKKLSDINLSNSWLQTSIVETGNILRGEKTVEELASQLLSKLAEILKFQAGAVYLGDDNGNLRLAGSYAFSHRKSDVSVFKPGEGLVGQAALEKKTLLFDNVPAKYIYLQSGLGEGEAPQVIVQPFLFQGQTIGVLELAAAASWDDLKCTFLDQMEESIAIAFHSIKTRHEMRRLLATTQEQAEELRVQQEELKEANEELEAQARALKESEASLQAQQEELRVTNEELEEKTHILEQQKAAVAIKNQELETAKTEIERKAREVEQASRYKSEFLANMSHELRTPLNSLLILSKSLMDNKKGNLNPDQVEAAEIIYNSGNELLTLINDILDLSKIESGRLDSHSEEIETDSIAS